MMSSAVEKADDALHLVRVLGPERLREIATVLEYANEFSRASRRAKDETWAVIKWLRAEADAMAESGYPADKERK